MAASRRSHLNLKRKGEKDIGKDFFLSRKEKIIKSVFFLSL